MSLFIKLGSPKRTQELGSPLRMMSQALQGEPLQKLSSFEKLSLLLSQEKRDDEERDASACKIGAWYRRIAKIGQIRRAMLPLPAVVVSLLLRRRPLPESFEQCQGVMAGGATDISKFLASLPLDPQLRAKNSQARSSRTLICAVLMALYPGDVLQADGVRDDSTEAFCCAATAKMLLVALRRLVQHTSSGSGLVFHRHLLVYRYAVRSFLLHFETWKALDAERVGRSLELPYCQAYSVMLAARMALRGESPQEQAMAQNVCTQTQQHLAKIRAMFLHVRGSPAGEARLEELNALVEASNPFDFLATQEGEEKREEVFQIITEPPSDGAFGGLGKEVSALAAAQRKVETEVTDQMRDAEMRLLERLSLIAGVENERLAYEICADPLYRLPHAPEPAAIAFPYDLSPPPSPRPSTQQSSSSSPSPAAIRGQMLRLINDRLVWSLLRSPFAVDGDLVAGAVGPFLAWAPGAQAVQILAGRVLASYEEGEAAYVDVEFLYDGTVERKLPVRPAPSGSASAQVYSVLWADSVLCDPRAFIVALEDVCGRIGGLTPKRPELLQQLLTSLDLPFLAQMLAARSLGGEELCVVACKLFFAIDQLQSQGRIEEPARKVWVKTYLAAARDPAQTWAGRVLLMPALFEFVSSSVEQISRDMANYYVDGLVPVLRQHGPRFLCDRLVQRVDAGKSSLAATAHAMQQHLRPGALNACLTTLAEAGAEQAVKLLQQFPEHDVPHEAVLGNAQACGPRDWFTVGLLAVVLQSLLQSPVRLDTRAGAALLPETFVWDASRLAAIRDEVDVLVVMASLGVTCRQQLYELSSALPPATRQAVMRDADDEELLRRLGVLLRESDCSLTLLVTEAQRHVRQAAVRHAVHGSIAGIAQPASLTGGSSRILGLSAGWEAMVEEAVKAAISERSAVLKLFTKRVLKVLLIACLRLPWKDQLKAMSLGNKALVTGLSQTAGKMIVLFECSASAYGEVYANILASSSLREALAK